MIGLSEDIAFLQFKEFAQIVTFVLVQLTAKHFEPILLVADTSLTIVRYVGVHKINVQKNISSNQGNSIEV